MTGTAEIVRVENASFRYGGDDPLALENISLTISEGEFVGLIGQNGSGKTTLARHLNGLLEPEIGEVRIRGRSTRGIETGRLSTTVGYVFQNPDHALFLTTVREEIAYSLGFRDMTEDARQSRIEGALEAFGLTALAGRHPASLGRGTRRLVILAATYAMEPDLLVLDEPTGGLDHRLTANLVRTLREYVASGRSVLLISHDMQLVANTCSRVIALHDGELAADCETGAFFQQQDILESTGLRAPDVARLAEKLDDAGFSADTISIAAFVRRYGALAVRIASEPRR